MKLKQKSQNLNITTTLNSVDTIAPNGANSISVTISVAGFRLVVVPIPVMLLVFYHFLLK